MRYHRLSRFERFVFVGGLVLLVLPFVAIFLKLPWEEAWGPVMLCVTSWVVGVLCVSLGISWLRQTKTIFPLVSGDIDYQKTFYLTKALEKTKSQVIIDSRAMEKTVCLYESVINAMQKAVERGVVIKLT